MSKVRYGVIGTGPRGQALIKAAIASGQVEIAAIADVQSGMLQQAEALTPDAKKFFDYRELLSLKEIDAVVIATPNHTHYKIIQDAIEAEKHILCEKPVVTSLQQLDEISKQIKEKDLIFQVGTELRYYDMALEMKRMVDRSEIGPVRMMWCKEFRPPFKEGFNRWRLSEISGGSFLEKNCHHFDLFNWIIDSRPTKVSAFGGNEVIYKKEGVLDNGWVIIEYENGARASLGLCLFREFEYYLELGIHGDKGAIECYAPDSKMQVKTARKRATYEFENYLSKGFDHGGEIEQHLAFVESIRTGKEPETNIEAARLSHMTSLAAEESVKTGKTIYLDKYLKED